VDYSFPSCRECGFLEKLLAAWDAYDQDAFGEACSDFDRISPLDPWKTSILLKIKKHVSSAAEDAEEVDLT
jgi:alpha-soluble NSF attachment protein